MAAKSPPAPAKPPKKMKPKREVDRVGQLERRLEAIEDRLDRMADALVPALKTWKNIRKRIPRWLLNTSESPVDAGEE